MATSNNIISLRRHDMDNLRTFLTGLVTVHHTSIAYGGSGGWLVKSAAVVGTSPLVTGFNMFNQSFFMGLFFWISGRVSAQSLEKTTDYGAFLKNKALRLGIPAVAYTLVVNPIAYLMVLPSLDLESISICLRHYYTNLDGVRGAVWYTVTLLCFDAIAVLVKKASQHQQHKASRADKVAKYGDLKNYGWLAVVLCSFLVKTQYPVGTFLPIIRLQPAYAFQYVYAYTLGYLAYTAGEQTMNGPFDSTTTATKAKESHDGEGSAEPMSSGSIPLSTALMISLMSMCLIPGPRYLDSTDWLSETMKQAFGGWTLPSFLYAFWNELAFNLLGPALMSYFNQWHNAPATSFTWNARYSYATFLVHTPVCVAIECLVEKILMSSAVLNVLRGSPNWQNLGPMVMTAAVGLTSAWVSAVVGKTLLEWLPVLKKLI
ncbi:acyltransferase 3 [Truncatella angustata]|uniref:Acyltransferase 3 n=1 Tax=Truncatella angustata TaxID=152316 RepID=A0A9P8UD68_9PEZI|nr:acyltransferase 3 [Truncatella angustata]KAH6647768.1 acyltransferase 3 [Truncatella angustata]